MRNVLALCAFALVPALLDIGLLASAHSSPHGVAYDFREAILPAARDVRHGISPYGPATADALRTQTAFVYPPLVAYLAVPFTLLPVTAAAYLASALALAGVFAVLWILHIRDWRCYGAALLWSPVVFTVRLGALSVLLALGLAVLWRARGNWAVSSIAAAAIITAKLFLWPLVVWLVATRRYRAAVATFAATAVLLLVPWSGIGFAGLSSYPHMLRILSSLEARESCTAAALLAKLGVPWGAAQLAGWLAGAAVLACSAHLGRSGRERTAFVLVVVAALMLSPIVWVHYYALLLVPVALLAPRLGPAWLLPILLFAVPVAPGAASAGALAIGLALAAGTVATAATRTA